MTRFSALNPSEIQIKRKLRWQKNIAEVLIAISEEPCYQNELAGRLGLDKQTIAKSILYLRNAGLISNCSANAVLNGGDNIREYLGGEKIHLKVSEKLNRIKSGLTNGISADTLRRMRIYTITDEGKKYLPLAIEILEIKYNLKDSESIRKQREADKIFATIQEGEPKRG